MLVLGFNRPDLLRELLRAVELYGPKALYVSLDGPRANNGDDLRKVEKCRRLLSNASFSFPIHTRFLPDNVGLRGAVVGALDWFFTHEPEGIVLEDDCIPSQAFFSFTELMLTRYRENQRVWGIGGFNPTGISFSGSSYGFIQFPVIWGWASWSDRWKRYDRTLKSFLLANESNQPRWQSKALHHAFDWHLQKLLLDSHTWDYQFSWTVASNKGLWLMPSFNLVRNLGHGPAATHTQFARFRRQPLMETENLTSPKRIEANVHANALFLRRHLGVFGFEPLNWVREIARRIKWLLRRRGRT